MASVTPEKLKPAIDEDIEDYFAMQEAQDREGKGGPAGATTFPIEVEKIDITVEESPGQFGPDTIVEKINQFWNR